MWLIEWRGCGVVLAESWPSWSFALNALNSKELVTYCTFSSGKGRKEFQATTLGTTLVKSLDKVRQFCGKSVLSPLVFIQGSAAFCQEMELYARMLEAIDVVSMVEQSQSGSMDFQERGDGQSSHLVRHHAIGGMTNGL